MPYILGIMSDNAQNPPPDNQQQAEFHTDMPVGEILRKGREHYGQSLEQVEASLRIRASMLLALENGEVDKLPGKAYALGFVRSYAEYLGLDGDKMVQLFKKQSIGNRIAPDLHFPIPASESKLPPWPLAVAFAIIGIVLIGIWAFYNMDDRSAVENIPSVAEVMGEGDFVGPKLPNNWEEVKARRELAAASMPEGPLAAEPDPVTEPEEEGIVLNIVENSWVEIRDAKGNAIVSQVLKKGEQYFVPDRPDLTMSLGNASGVEIILDGKALPLLGKRGQVRRNVSLDSKALKALAQN